MFKQLNNILLFKFKKLKENITKLFKILIIKIMNYYSGNVHS